MRRVFFAESGFTVVELMVAAVIGLLVVAAAVHMHAQSRGLFQVNERIARLQEQGRAAFSVIEPDIELAGFYGFTQLPEVIRLVAGGSMQTALASAAEMRQFPTAPGDALPPAVAGVPAAAHVCGVNFALDVSMPVQGWNDAFAMGRSPAASCKPYQSRAQPGADTLTLRRVQAETTPAEANRLQIYASRHTSLSEHLLFFDGMAPGPLDEHRRIHTLQVRTYYVARDSVGQSGFPALRVKALTRSGGSIAFADDEVMPGVEDLQVQFAVAEDASATRMRYVHPDDPVLLTARVLAVRMWLRIRSDEPEPSFDDPRTYTYAGVTYTPSGAERHFRRVVLSRTVAVRNARSS